MNQFSPEKWSLWLGNMPMPEDANEEMMWAAYDAIQEMERRDEAVRDIAFFSKMLEHDKELLKEAEDWSDTEKADTIRHIIDITNDIINTYRSKL